jgi:dCTP diphosphatase
MDLKELQKIIDDFAQRREWAQFHSVNNLTKALVAEVGELAESVQWISDDEMSAFLDSGGRVRVAEELADVAIYAIRLADRAGVDLGAAIVAKIAANEEKYPVEKSRGTSKKYTELE